MVVMRRGCARIDLVGNFDSLIMNCVSVRFRCVYDKLKTFGDSVNLIDQ